MNLSHKISFLSCLLVLVLLALQKRSGDVGSRAIDSRRVRFNVPKGASHIHFKYSKETNKIAHEITQFIFASLTLSLSGTIAR